MVFQENFDINELEFFHDEPDSESDLFNFDDLAKNLSTMILKQIDTPFSILIHGEWGSGKTTLLKKLQYHLKLKKENHHRIIFFESWRYEKIDPVAALLQIINEAIENENNGEKDQKRQRLTDSIKGVGLLLFDMAIRAHTNMTLPEMKQYFEETYHGIRNLRETLEEIIKDKVLVILIDDLDRCSYKSMMEIFESIKLFLNVKGMITIVAADNEKLVLAWRHSYTNLTHGEGEEYFDKIFQLKLALPLKDVYQIQKYVEKLSSIVPFEFRGIIESIDNPRRIKQILNRIFFIIRYSKFSEKYAQNINEYFPLVIIWSVVTIAYPDLSKIISIYPRTLKEILLVIPNYNTYNEFYDNLFANVKSDARLSQVFPQISNFTRQALLLTFQKKSLFQFFRSMVEYENSLKNKAKRNETIYLYNENIIRDIILDSGLL